MCKIFSDIILHRLYHGIRMLGNSTLFELIICLESKVKYSHGSLVVDCNRCSLDSVVIVY